MLSIIATFRDEEENLGLLYRELAGVLARVPFACEVIFVDDYSRDGGWSVVQKIVSGNPKVRAVKNAGRSGKGQALAAGIAAAQGDQLIFLDSDTQNNPADVPRFLEKLNQGFDLVNGRRRTSSAPLLIRCYSSFFNWFLRTFYRSPFHDVNSGFKAFRRAVLEKTPFDPEVFRFFPLAVFEDGFRVAEMEIDDRPRVYGRSKFGVFKIFRGFRDFFRFLAKRRQTKTAR